MSDPSAVVDRTVLGGSRCRLAIQQAGPPDGVPVVVLHGLCGTAESVLSSGYLARAGYRVTAYDARGHGRSERAERRAAYGYEHLVADLRAVLAACADEPPLLVGASMGGVTAVRLLLEMPEAARGLVLVTPAFDPHHAVTADERRRAELFVRALRTGDPDAFDAADPLPGDHPAITTAIRALLRRRLEGHADLDAVADAVEVLVADSAFASFDQLGSLRLPSLVVASHDQWDALHPRRTAEAYASALAAAQLVSEAPDHVPLAWRPRRIAQLVAQFARRVPFPTRSPTWSPCLD